MAQYDFDQVIDHHNTNSLKYDFEVERGRPVSQLCPKTIKQSWYKKSIQVY